MKWPKAIDEHKPSKPAVPNGFGVFYVLASVLYLFILSALQINTLASLALASCLLFGGLLGLFDDLVDLRWRYKAVLPLVASLPLVALRLGNTTVATYFFGKVDFGVYYFLIIIPVVVAVATNTVNMLGGLNGLETIGSLLVLLGLTAASGEITLLLVPLLSLALLAFYNFRGRIFVGNVGSFAFGITAPAYAIIMNIEQALAISLIPYIINSVLTLFSAIILKEMARTILTTDGKLYSTHIRSLRTLVLHNRPMSERKCVALISLMIALSSFLAAFAR